ncbi:MAG TPA: hypothetical protein VIU41_09515 [Geobacteraceae bacterium]
MKKISAILALALTLSAANAFAAWLTPDNTGTVTVTASNVGAGVVFSTKVSANVFVDYKVDTTGGTFYTLATYHASGTKSYGSGSGDSRIYMKENGGVNSASGITPAAAVTAAAVADWAGWTAVK